MPCNQGLAGKAFSIAATECKYMRAMAGPGTGKTFANETSVGTSPGRGIGSGAPICRYFYACRGCRFGERTRAPWNVYSDFSKLGRIHMSGRRGACRLDYLEKASETFSKAMEMSLI